MPRTCCWRRRWAPRTCTWWSVYDYTSPSVAEFRARQARTRRYWVCVSPRSVSTSWSGFWLFLHILSSRLTVWQWGREPLLERARPFWRGHPFWRGRAPLERARPFWRGRAPLERALPFLRGRSPFWKGMFTLTWWVRKGAPLLKRARLQCYIEKLNLLIQHTVPRWCSSGCVHEGCGGVNRWLQTGDLVLPDFLL